MPDPFNKSFEDLTGNKPFPWQEALAKEASCRSQLIRIPTGLGKTKGVLATWIYHRIFKKDKSWPRRLIWCLPMRVLVEQTEQVALELASKMTKEIAPRVYIAMGGEDAGEWFLDPESSAIIIGTQDMLLSKALNRGYASPRARWPMEFGLLNQDSLWVMDEVQLMDVGLATSAQIQAYREEDKAKSIRPCHTWWMSATLQPKWLESVDTKLQHPEWIKNPCSVKGAQRIGGLWEIKKTLEIKKIDIKKDADFAKKIIAEHTKINPNEYGKITLVVCNTVERASATFAALIAQKPSCELKLIHSRFRSQEREEWRDKFLSRSSCSKSVNRIIVSTQVVEAGVDISAGCLITELAPWPSLVQRFGRCARYGGTGKVIIIDRDFDETTALPYNIQDLKSALNCLNNFKELGVGILELEKYEETLTDDQRAELYPFEPAHLLLRKEFDELFDTTPDLTGSDLDISRFIRSGDERDLQVFWLELEKSTPPVPEMQPLRKELCAIQFLKARNWLCGEETKTNRKPKLLNRIDAWVWDWIDGEWIEATRSSLLPGRIVCVSSKSGGYLPDFGFNPESKDPVIPVQRTVISNEAKAFEKSNDHQDGEDLSFNPWKTIAFHSMEVSNEAEKICNELDLPEGLKKILIQAGIWHDWGKSHPAFQGAIKKSPERPERSDLAKGPQGAWRRPPKHMYKYLDGSEERPAFRHELASALGLFGILKEYAPQHKALLGPWSEFFKKMGIQQDSVIPQSQISDQIQKIIECSQEEFDLLVYLIASHHGKVRVALHAAPKDQDYKDIDGKGLPIRGIREGDRLPSISLVPDSTPIAEVSLTLSPATIGLSEQTGASWRERSQALIERFSPPSLAFLESVFRTADVRASRLKTNDPIFKSEGQL